MLSRNATLWLPDCCGTSRRNTTKRTIPERKTGRIAAQNATPGTPKHPLDLWQAHSVKKHSGCLPPICHQPLSAALADSPPIARPQRQIKRHPQPGHQAQTALGNSWKDCSCPKFFVATKNFAATGTAATMAPYATAATAGRQKEGNKKTGSGNGQRIHHRLNLPALFIQQVQNMTAIRMHAEAQPAIAHVPGHGLAAFRARKSIGHDGGRRPGDAHHWLSRARANSMMVSRPRAKSASVSATL